MIEQIRSLFAANFIAHGFCMRWQSDVIWLHVVSDSAIVVAYLSIPALLFYFIKKRADVPFHWLFKAFCLFIVSCGITHAMEVVTLWYPLYRLAGVLKAITAVVSLGTAGGLVALMPKLLQIPSVGQLQQAIGELDSEIAQKKIAEAALESAYNRMEEQVQVRTLQLANASAEKLKSEMHFRATFDQAAIGLARVSLTSHYTEVNKSFCEIVGYTSEELVGTSFFDITYPDDLEDERARSRALRAGQGRQYSMEKRYIHKNGHLVWVNMTVALVSNEGVPDFFIAAVKDITPRKVAEAKLLESERKFKELANAMPHIVWTADASGRFEFFNDRWTDLLSNPGAMSHAEGLKSVTEDEDYQLLESLWAESLRSRTPHEVQYRQWDRLTAEYRWYLRRVTPIRDGQDRISRWVGTCTDIHQQKLTEQALQESERILKNREQVLSALFDEGTIGDFTWDIATDEITAHPSVWKMYGLPSEPRRRSAEHVRERHRSEDVPRIRSSVEAALDRRAPLDFEFRILRDDATLRWIACRGVVVRNNAGVPIQTHGVNIDITALKRAEAEVEERERLFRQLADEMPQIVWTAKPDGQVDYFNERWYELTGFDRSATGHDWSDVLHPDEVQNYVERWVACVRSALPYELQHRFWDRRRCEFRWYLARAIPLRGREGSVIRWIGTSTEIHDQTTAKDSLEREVRSRTIELEKSLLEKETLLKEVHHRVKNNLQVISSLLNMQVNSLTDEYAISALKDSQRRVLSMAMVHERLYGTQKMDEIDFAGYSEELVQALFRSFAHPGIRLRLETSKVLLNIDQAIPCGLILSELVTNAMKYAYPAQASGEITIELAENSSGMVTLAVSDNGAGLPVGLDWKSLKSLGLPIVRILANQLGGDLSVGAGAGTRMSVCFPRASKDRVAAVA